MPVGGQISVTAPLVAAKLSPTRAVAPPGEKD